MGTKFLTLAEMAAELGIEPGTLRRQRRLGRLKATLVGKTYIVTTAERDRYRREHLGQVGRPKGS